MFSKGKGKPERTGDLDHGCKTSLTSSFDLASWLCLCFRNDMLSYADIGVYVALAVVWVCHQTCGKTERPTQHAPGGDKRKARRSGQSIEFGGEGTELYQRMTHDHHGGRLPVNETVPLQPSTTVVYWSAHVLLSSVSMPGLDLPNGVHDGLAKLSRSTVHPSMDHL
jgi:hypothetical protein